jgi:uncharacterized protein YihD (DUF1040 family)
MRNDEAPKCPKISRLIQLKELVKEFETHEDDKAGLVVWQDLFDALDWLHTMLTNRTTYHKKRNLKTKILFELAREQGLDTQVNKLTESALHDYVSAQPADRDDVQFNITGDDDNDDEA